MVEVFYVLGGEVTFAFDDETVRATEGVTVNVPPNVWHEVLCERAARLITIFTPGGFDHYLAELATMTDAQFGDEALITTLGEKYDIWTR